MKPLASAVTEMRFNGIGLLVGGIALFGIAVRAGGIQEPLFYVGASVALAYGTFMANRKDARSALEPDLAPPTPFRHTSFDIAEWLRRWERTHAIELLHRPKALFKLRIQLRPWRKPDSSGAGSIFFVSARAPTSDRTARPVR